MTAKLLTQKKVADEFRAELARGRFAYVFDFDGTLAALHPDPMAVVLTPEVRSALKRIHRTHPVYIVTGRALRHIRRKIPASIPIIGEHGSAGTDENYLLPEFKLDRALARGWRLKLNTELRQTGWAEHAWVEAKDFSITVHHRSVKDSRGFEKFLREWVASLPARERPVVLVGKKVFNFLPAPAPTKGDAVRWILRQLPRGTRLLYVGDEPTDENAFRVLGQRHLTVFLGPEKIPTAARFRLPSQAAFARFLASLEPSRIT